MANGAPRLAAARAAPQPPASVADAAGASGAKRLAGNAAYVLWAPQTDAVLDQTATALIERWVASVPLWTAFVAPGLAALVAVALALRRRRLRVNEFHGGNESPAA